MGLAEPRKRRKISYDPNNTTWSRNTNTFGHRILTQQGWKVGETLGVRDAPHSSDFTSASTTYIRAAVKDDTLGLGMNLAKKDETLNAQRLDAYQDVLDRLNGKAKEVNAKNKETRKDFARKYYANTKYGRMNFIRGGFLVGDELPRSREQEEKEVVNTENPEKTDISKQQQKDKEKRSKEQKKVRKEEKRGRKEERRKQKEAKVRAKGETSKSSLHGKKKI